MYLKYFYDKSLAQASYMVGCAKTGEALIVDPARDIQQYLDAASQEGLRITHVTETHIHADFVSGSRELSAATDATIYLSDMGGENWKYGYSDDPNVILVTDGDSWLVGNIKVEVLHTPGHTPEHVSFMITDTARADKPIGVFTGDFLFVGDVGRPDLLEEAAGMIGTANKGASQQFASVDRFKQLPDYLQIWPGHGAGSACGKSLGAIPSTTLGYEKLFNPAFQFESEAGFSAWLLKDQPEAPRYFAQMKKVNKIGPELLENLPDAQQMDRAQLNDLLEHETLVVDLRNGKAFASGHVPGTVSVPASNSGFTTYIGWYVDYEQPLYFITPDENSVLEMLSKLRAIGIDNTPSYFMPEVAAHGTETLPQISAQELAERLPKNGLTVLDVRGATEYAEEHIEGAQNIAVGLLPRHLDELPKDGPIVAQCASGYRAQVAASYLRAKGLNNVVLMGEPKGKWAKALPTAVGAK
ncbi:MAG: MBL fold metallo-hydrolase [Chloroflexota bacterium]